MTDRVLDFSQAAAHLSIRNGLLVVRQGDAELDAIPCGEIAAVICSHRQVTFTQAVLGQLAEAGAVFVACDANQRPAAMLLPLEGHHVQARRFTLQAGISQPRRKRLWQEVARSKIRAQARVLLECTGNDGGLPALVARVRSGDRDNVEARAARRYWAVLFGRERFQRSDGENARNHWLNYGYAVLRAAAARAICGCGLHPTFGLQHRNQANAFALADDLMEPFRPVIDRIVAAAPARTLDQEGKRELIAAVAGRYEVEGEARTLFAILTGVAQSLVRALEGNGALWLPDWRAAGDAADRKPARSERRDQTGAGVAL
jgi:CRISPR-associated protein Cas1